MSKYDRFQSFSECEEAQQKLADLTTELHAACEAEQEAMLKYGYACDKWKTINKDITRAEGVLEFWMAKNEETCKDDE